MLLISRVTTFFTFCKPLCLDSRFEYEEIRLVGGRILRFFPPLITHGFQVLSPLPVFSFLYLLQLVYVISITLNACMCFCLEKIKNLLSLLKIFALKAQMQTTTITCIGSISIKNPVHMHTLFQELNICTVK